MSQLSAVIVSANLENSEIISNFLDLFNYNTVGNTQYGFDAVNIVLDKKPDLVICDSVMFDLDVCSLYSQLSDFGAVGNTVFVVVSSVNDPSFINLVLGSGIDHFALIPTDYFVLDKNIRKLLAAKTNVKPVTAASNSDEFEITVYIKSLLSNLGVNAKLVGYEYIIASVILLIFNPHMPYHKGIYTKIAEQYNVSPGAIETGIRHAIEKSWSIGDISVLNDVFSYSYDSSKPNPSNTEYISMLVEKVKLKFNII